MQSFTPQLIRHHISLQFSNKILDCPKNIEFLPLNNPIFQHPKLQSLNSHSLLIFKNSTAYKPKKALRLTNWTIALRKSSKIIQKQIPTATYMSALKQMLKESKGRSTPSRLVLKHNYEKGFRSTVRNTTAGTTVRLKRSESIGSIDSKRYTNKHFRGESESKKQNNFITNFNQDIGFLIKKAPKAQMMDPYKRYKSQTSNRLRDTTEY